MLYFAGQAPFTIYGYQLEFDGMNTFAEIQYTNYLWFAINVFILIQLIRNSRLTVTKQVDLPVKADKSKVNDKAKKE